jgi:hypothetical protein
MAYDPPSDAPVTGEESTSRHRVFSTAAHADGQMRLGYFRAHRTEAITKVRIACTTAAGATPSLIRVGVYSIAANGDLTLVAATTSDTSLLAATATEYEKALSATWNKVAGQWYATALLVKTAAASPAIAAESFGSPALTAAVNGRPRLAALLGSQTDLPASITSASLSAGQFIPYVFFEQ